MPIKTVQQRLTQVGVIRLGDQLISAKTGKPYPNKLDKFRFTSPSRARVEAVAARYCGEVKPWKNTTGPEWEVYTTADDIAVLVPPQTIDPNLEHWGNGYRDRFCDGETEKLRDIPCMCAAQWGERFADRAPVGQFCKPTTRIALMLAEIDGLGTWKLESKGWNAAAELPMLASAIANAAMPVPARLIVDRRSGKGYDPKAAEGKQIKPKDYIVPILVFDFLTPAQAFGGQINAAARKALGTSPDVEDRPALVAAAAESQAALPTVPWTPTRVMAAAKNIDNVPDLQALWKAAAADGALTDEVKEFLAARSAAVSPPKAEKPAAPGPEATPVKPEPPAATTPDKDAIVDAEIVDEVKPAMSGAQAWQATLMFAGESGWNRAMIAGLFLDLYQVDYRDATDDQVIEFYRRLAAGEVKPS